VDLCDIFLHQKISYGFGITLDYLAGKTTDMAFDRRTIERIQDIEKLSESEKDNVFALLDVFLAKSKNAGNTQIK